MTETYTISIEQNRADKQAIIDELTALKEQMGSYNVVIPRQYLDSLDSIDKTIMRINSLFEPVE